MVRRTLPLVQPIIWISGDSKLDVSTTTFVKRHINNAADFVHGRTVSGWQGDRSLVIPDELQFSTSEEWSDDRQKQWRTFLEPLVPVSLDVVVSVDHAHCSCPGLPDEGHPAACQCSCSHCNDFRKCPCDAGECVCPPLCNCCCMHCVHASPETRKDAEICVTPGCSNKRQVGKKMRRRFCSKCRSVRQREAAKRNAATASGDDLGCATDACEKPKRAGNRYCSSCIRTRAKSKKDSAAEGAGENEPPCVTDGCDGKRQFWRRYCLPCIQNQFKAAKMAAPSSGNARPCVTDGCDGKRQFRRRYCTSCIRQQTKSRKAAQKRKLDEMLGEESTSDDSTSDEE